MEILSNKHPKKLTIRHPGTFYWVIMHKIRLINSNQNYNCYQNKKAKFRH